MNLTALFHEKSLAFPLSFNKHGINAVILHIERAQLYWQRAKNESDSLLFTDVIYRTNQAFEGILKEAYAVLTGKDASKLASHKIEEYFAQAALFRPRVLGAFTHYRTEWRNEATHNYTLFFSEQEALLAIHSVSAFCIMLMDQILTKANELHEHERAKRFAATVRNCIKGYRSLSFYEKVIGLLAHSYRFLKYPPQQELSEQECIGLLSGFIAAVDPSIQANTESYQNLQNQHYPDLILSHKNEKIIIQVKKHRRETPVRIRNAYSEAQYALSYHMQSHAISKGILILLDEDASEGTTRSLTDPQQHYTITFIQPLREPHPIAASNSEWTCSGNLSLSQA